VLQGSWVGISAGGCFNYGSSEAFARFLFFTHFLPSSLRLTASWRYNPQLFLQCSLAPCSVTVTLHQKGKEHSPWHIGFYVARADRSGFRVLHIKPEDIVAKVGPQFFLSGCFPLVLIHPPSPFHQAPFSNSTSVKQSFTLDDSSTPVVVIPCTFKPGQECDFRLSFDASSQITVNPVDPHHEYRMYTQVGKWEGNNAGGCKNHPTVTNNPQFSLEAKKSTTITVTLSQTEKVENFFTCSAPLTSFR